MSGQYAWLIERLLSERNRFPIHHPVTEKLLAEAASALTTLTQQVEIGKEIRKRLRDWKDPHTTRPVVSFAFDTNDGEMAHWLHKWDHAMQQETQMGDKAVPGVNGGASTTASGTELTDLQLTKLCAQAMGIELCQSENCAAWPTLHGDRHGQYAPLHDDAQAMALVKRFGLACRMPELGVWEVHEQIDAGRSLTGAVIYADTDINRPIVLCVAKMQVDRTAPETSTRSADE